MRKGLKAVLFDLDGTLVDTHFLIFRCLNESLEAAAGIKFEETWWHDNAGKPLHLLYPIALEANGRTDVSIDDLIVDYRKRLKSYEHEVRLFPGALEMIEEVERGGLQLALVTTKHSEAADRHLESVGLAGRFAVVMTGDQCKHYKPHPDPFERVLTKLSLEPAACISVGD
ncbi:MAG: HAD hydrolase-like protein, partial [Chthonomonadales bacterium]